MKSSSKIITIEQIFWIADYLRYLWNSHSRHGTHSPFVYAFTDEVLYQKQDPVCLDLIELERSRYLGLNGSYYALIPQRKYLSLVFRMLNWNSTYFSNFIEIGSSLGCIPSIIQEVDPSVRGITLEPILEKQKLEDSFLPEIHNQQKIELQEKISLEKLQSIVQQIEWLDVVFLNDCWEKLIDQESLDYLIDRLSFGGVLIINRLDAFWSQRDIWDKLIRHKRVTANIDLFKMGMIFVRKEQQKETFILRY